MIPTPRVGQLMLHSLLVILLLSAGCWASDSTFAYNYYCSTANPTGLLFSNAASSTTQRLSENPIVDMAMSPNGVLAVLTGDDQCVSDIVDIYKSGRRILRKNIGCVDVSLVGWTHDALVIEVEGKLRQIDYKTGNMSNINSIDGVKAILPYNKGHITISETPESVVVEYVAKSGKKQRLEKQGGAGQYTLVGSNFLVIELHPINKGSVDTTKSNLWVIDLSNQKQKSIEFTTLNIGICAGRQENELIVCIPVGSKSIQIKTIDLNTGRQKALATAAGNGHLSSIVGLSPDRKWIVLTTGYGSVGPGELWALNILNHKQIKIKGNVYDCILVQ